MSEPLQQAHTTCQTYCIQHTPSVKTQGLSFAQLQQTHKATRKQRGWELPFFCVKKAFDSANPRGGADQAGTVVKSIGKLCSLDLIGQHARHLPPIVGINMADLFYSSNFLYGFQPGAVQNSFSKDRKYDRMNLGFHRVKRETKLVMVRTLPVTKY